MVKYKSILYIVIIGLIVLFSGCTNGDKKDYKIINISTEYLILSDIDLKEALGPDWETVSRSNYPISYYNNNDFINISQINFNKGQYIIGYNSVMIGSDINQIENDYNRIEKEFSTESGKIERLNIGDKGIIYTYVNDTKNIIHILFIKNNILVSIEILSINREIPNVDAETAIQLAKEQDAKISKVLESTK